MRHYSILLLAGLLSSATAADFYVASNGADNHSGTATSPLKTLGAAQKLVRAWAGRQPVTVHLAPGIYYLPETVTFTSEDSGTASAPINYRGDEMSVVISGGAPLALKWQSDQGGIFKAQTPAGLRIDQLYVNGKRQRMARFPNAVPGKNVFDVWELKHGGRGNPGENPVAVERIARWANPAGGYYHAMHPALWGDMHWLIMGKKPDGTDLELAGGWQNNRPNKAHSYYRFVENIREELDAPGEWFHDAIANELWLYPEAGTGLQSATIEVVRLAHLIEFQGSKEKPVKFVNLKGLIFRHAARTFMQNKEPLLRSDWTVYRGGAVMYNGAEDCALEDSVFDQVGGNTVFVNHYNRRIAVRGCLLKDSGASGVVFVGDPGAVRNPLFRYGPQNYAGLDLTPGPNGDNFPADCLVEDCLITRTGRDEKQTAAVQISMSLGITVRHCSIYDVPRAGININEGTFGGHVIEDCDIFNTVLETGDHGSFNSWGRDRFWDPKIATINQAVVANPTLPKLDVVKPITLRHNRWRCDHGWDIDLDDGSSFYIITDNLLLSGGLKMREGYHRIATNNIIVNNSLHPHCWLQNSGDQFKNNIVMGAYRPAAIDYQMKWGAEVDYNLFTTSDADRTKFARNGCDAHSIVGDPLFTNPEQGNFQVQAGSPALSLGFRNFPMDFGVQKTALKAIAKRPEMPKFSNAVRIENAKDSPKNPRYWLGARLHGLEGEEFSAFGVSKEDGGVQLVEVPAGSPAAQSGLQKDDLIQSLNQRRISSEADLFAALVIIGDAPLKLQLIRNQQATPLRLTNAPFIIVRSGKVPTDLAPLEPPVNSSGTVSANQPTKNDPLVTLTDGALKRGYGPVFPNGVRDGAYKLDLGSLKPVTAITSWSHNQNNNRGRQSVTLYGSNAATDPGFKFQEPALFTPLGTIDTTSVGNDHFLAATLRARPGKTLGTFRWIIWQVTPVTAAAENTAFQEFTVEAGR